MSDRFCLSVKSRALSSVGDIQDEHLFVKPYVPSDNVEGSSVAYSVVDKLFVEFKWCVCVFFPRIVFAWQCPFLAQSVWSNSLPFWLIRTLM